MQARTCSTVESCPHLLDSVVAVVRHNAVVISVIFTPDFRKHFFHLVAQSYLVDANRTRRDTTRVQECGHDAVWTRQMRA